MICHRLATCVVGAVLLAAGSAAAQTAQTAPPASKPTAWGVLPPAPPVEKRVLELRVASAVVARVTPDDLAKLKPVSSSKGGKAKLYALKEVLATFVGPGTRVVDVALADSKIPVDEKAWADTTRTPVLWQNRRGLFKVGWLDAKGDPMPATMELRDVLALDVVKPAAH